MAFEKYDIKFYRLTTWLTPHWLRKQTFVLLIRSCVYPLVLIHNAFTRYRKAKLYDLYINGQICYLEAFLNDRFDSTERRIFIDDVEISDPLYVYQEIELLPLFVYRQSEDKPVYVYTDGEALAGEYYDFIVVIPADVLFDEVELRAMIATKLSGKKYKVQVV